MGNYRASLSKVTAEGIVRVAWKAPRAKRAFRVTDAGQVRKHDATGKWWSKALDGTKYGPLSTRKAAAEKLVAHVAAMDAGLPTPAAMEAKATAEAPPAKPVARQGRGDATQYSFTEADIVKARDEDQLAWREVATRLGLPNTGSARRAYRRLTGRAPSDSQVGVKRSRATAHTNGSAARMKPKWDDDTDHADIIDALTCKLCDGKGFVHRSGKTQDCTKGVEVTVLRKGTDLDTGDQRTETVVVRKLVRFRNATGSGQPDDVSIDVVDVVSGGARTFYVRDIVQVR